MHDLRHRLRPADIETTNKKRSKLTGKDNYGTWSASMEMASRNPRGKRDDHTEEQWEELNGVALSEIQSIQLLGRLTDHFRYVATCR
jgi:hypothetical protein